MAESLFFEHQRDPDATRMASFPARDWDAFMAEAKRLADQLGGIEQRKTNDPKTRTTA